MRKQKKVIIWPVYFDASSSRRAGRKVPKNVAVLKPTITELLQVSKELGLKPEADLDASHSANPWKRTGRLKVQLIGNKTQTNARIAKKLAAIRQVKK